MEKLVEYIESEWEFVSQAPFVFLLLAVLMYGVAYVAIRWRYSSVIAQLRESNDTLKERLNLKAEQAESYKEKALKSDAAIEFIVTADQDELAKRALSFVENFREFIDRSSRDDDKFLSAEHSLQHRNLSEAEQQLESDKIHDEMARNGRIRIEEYDRRFKVDAILLRDELRTRLVGYKPPSINSDPSYEQPVNYFGFNQVADEIELMAKRLINKNAQPT